MTSRRALALSAGVIVLYWAGSAASRLLRPHPLPHGVISIALDVSLRAVIVLVVVGALLHAGGESIRGLGFTRDGHARLVLRSLALAAGLFVLANVVLNPVFSALLGPGATPPVADLFRDPREAPYWIFCALVGGGFTEELMRAFVLTRFEKLLGRWAIGVALVLDSIVFGLGHLYQGRASAVTSGMTGVVLGLIFLWRRRVVDAMAVHAIFDLMGIAAAYALYAR
jgi:membrane protease YdiL (CAAX protease family)